MPRGEYGKTRRRNKRHARRAPTPRQPSRFRQGGRAVVGCSERCIRDGNLCTTFPDLIFSVAAMTSCWNVRKLRGHAVPYALFQGGYSFSAVTPGSAAAASPSVRVNPSGD
ncbi:hypothetical protein MRX96_019763 [Rhipicephalus microplus]